MISFRPKVYTIWSKSEFQNLCSGKQQEASYQQELLYCIVRFFRPRETKRIAEEVKILPNPNFSETGIEPLRVPGNPKVAWRSLWGWRPKPRFGPLGTCTNLVSLLLWSSEYPFIEIDFYSVNFCRDSVHGLLPLVLKG